MFNSTICADSEKNPEKGRWGGVPKDIKVSQGVRDNFLVIYYEHFFKKVCILNFRGGRVSDPPSHFSKFAHEQVINKKKTE